jgi:hypothetical protein
MAEISEEGDILSGTASGRSDPKLGELFEESQGRG